METIDSNIDKLRAPANFVISGATGSGKTYFLLKLLQDWPFDVEMGDMVYFYNVWQPLFEEYMRKFPNLMFVQGLNLEKIENFETEQGKVHVCICDDLADTAVKSDAFARLFTVYGHHKCMLNFFITQNPFFKGPLSTTINRNTHYFILLKTPHLNVLDVLNYQLYGNKGPLKDAYIQCIKEKPYNYLLIDVFNDQLENRLRSNILSDEQPIIIWRPKDYK